MSTPASAAEPPPSLLSQLKSLRKDQLGESLTLGQISCFVHSAAHLKRDMALPATLKTSYPDQPPVVLSASFAQFLSDAVGISEAQVDQIWSVFKQEIWESPNITVCTVKDYQLFEKYGWPLGIGAQNYLYFMYHMSTAALISPNLFLVAFSFYPPVHGCINADCSAAGSILKKERHQKVIVVTLGRGIQPAWTTHLYCPSKYMHTV
ncbi:hypothetical protein NP233_g5296 [Leucocoprinus birnbaumii]|uniref:CxC5 like cysteine cluster associated with KDZ domain-containing protein n=1 Tax=Leucocoprinus birnbaumii TaxID=56174 RepID=A0AAD5YWK2_9AGAR|nr:hypothetical protein NP233_g5296 [Leucocoprinus birnbaumii]